MKNLHRLFTACAFALLFSITAVAQPSQPAVNQSGAVTLNSLAIWQGTRLIKSSDGIANCAAQGAILYRGASGWLCLGAGTNGQFLQTQGAGADPVWAGGGAGTGTVTSVGLATPNSTLSLSGTNPVTTIGTINVDLPSLITPAGPIGSGTVTPVITADAYGRLTALTSATITPPFSALTGSLACSQTPALTGDVTTSAGSCATTLANVPSGALPNVITAAGPIGSATVTPIITFDAKGRLTTVTSATIAPPFSAVTGSLALNQIAAIANNTALGNVSGGSAAPVALTATQVTANLVNPCNATTKGAVPTPPNNTTTFLRGDCTWAAAGTPTFSAPQIATRTSGSGTYTVPANTLYLRVRMIGGGGGAGAGGGSNVAGNGGNTTFDGSTYIAGGGQGGTSSGAAAAGAGGTNTNCTISFEGADGDMPPAGGSNVSGAPSVFGGRAPSVAGNVPGANSKANTGSGGSPGRSTNAGGGGGAGGYCEFIISSPAASYTWAVGAGGTGATGTQNGGNGAAGIIIIEAYFQ